jgi:hypothetical protein
MRDDSRPNLPPFPWSYRASGLLLHVTSLPSLYGIGDMGPATIASIDKPFGVRKVDSMRKTQILARTA